MLCNSKKDNELVFGKLLNADGVTVHYFCLVNSAFVDFKFS